MEERGRGRKLKHRRKTPDGEVRAASLRKLGFTSYRLYLQSPLWEEIRLRVLERDHFWCRVCRAARASQVHHLRYTVEVMRGKAKQLRYLISICPGCHRSIEFEGDRKRGPVEVVLEGRRQTQPRHHRTLRPPRELSLDQQFRSALERDRV